LPTPPAFDVPVREGEGESEYCRNVWCGKPRMVCLPDGEKMLTICVLVSTQHTNVTDRRTPHDGRASRFKNGEKMKDR